MNQVNIADLFGPPKDELPELPKHGTRSLVCRWLGPQLFEISMTSEAHTRGLVAAGREGYKHSTVKRILEEDAVEVFGCVVVKFAGTEIEKLLSFAEVRQWSNWAAQAEVAELIKRITDGPNPIDLIGALA